MAGSDVMQIKPIDKWFLLITSNCRSSLTPGLKDLWIDRAESKHCGLVFRPSLALPCLPPVRRPLIATAKLWVMTHGCILGEQSAWKQMSWDSGIAAGRKMLLPEPFLASTPTCATTWISCLKAALKELAGHWPCVCPSHASSCKSPPAPSTQTRGPL